MRWRGTEQKIHIYLFSKMYMSWSVSAITASTFGGHCWTKIITVISLTEQTISLSSKSKENGEGFIIPSALHILKQGSDWSYKYWKETQHFLAFEHDRFPGLWAISLKIGSQFLREGASVAHPNRGDDLLHHCFQSLVNNLKMDVTVSQMYSQMSSISLRKDTDRLKQGFTCMTACRIQWKTVCQWKLHIPPNCEYNYFLISN